MVSLKSIPINSLKIKEQLYVNLGEPLWE